MISEEHRAEIGVIGGSGLYDPGILESMERVKVYTPYGEPSDDITVGMMGDKKVAFLPRHGKGHRIPPHMINYRANIWALESMGVRWVMAVSAVGSLQDEYKPGDIVVPDQFIDMTKARSYTFFDGPRVAHVSMADPFCDQLREELISTTRGLGYSVHDHGTYICIEGPRFSTRAESRLWRSWGAHIVGMTLIPEVNLACEAQMCYAMLSLVTDYDVWAERPVTAEEVTRTMNENVEMAKDVLVNAVYRLPSTPDPNRCSCCEALKTALL